MDLRRIAGIGLLLAVASWGLPASAPRQAWARPGGARGSARPLSLKQLPKPGSGPVAVARGGKRVSVHYVWQVGAAPRVKQFAALAAQALQSRTSPTRLPDKQCLLVVVGPDLPPKADLDGLVRTINDDIPVLGIGSVGLQVLQQLKPEQFQPADPPQAQTNAVEPDSSALQELYGDEVKEASPLYDRQTVRLYKRPGAVALADNERFKSGVTLRLIDPPSVVAAWQGNYAFWGASEVDALEPELLELFQVMTVHTAMYSGSSDILVGQVARILAEEEARELEEASLQVQKLLRKPFKTQVSVPIPDWDERLRIPTAGVLTSKFGFRFHPILRKLKLHTGQDVGAPTGTPVYAAAAGVVQQDGQAGGYGQRVILLHGQGMATLYAHLSRFAPNNGKKVRKGELIGYVGTTGRSTGPHLHFEVRKNGVPINPAPFFKS